MSQCTLEQSIYGYVALYSLNIIGLFIDSHFLQNFYKIMLFEIVNQICVLCRCFKKVLFQIANFCSTFHEYDEQVWSNSIMLGSQSQIRILFTPNIFLFGPGNYLALLGHPVQW